MAKPYLIEFEKHGNPEIGYLSVAQFQNNIPFEIKRIFWTYGTPEEIIRGRHAHHKTEMVLIAMQGTIIVNTEDLQGNIETFKLEDPNTGLYIPVKFWHTMQYHFSALQLVITSTEYQPKDYIRDYNEFKKMQGISKK
jgi:dTDP-4-dehydrorhamnose 3,5-epimerase-like enzyme